MDDEEKMEKMKEIMEGSKKVYEIQKKLEETDKEIKSIELKMYNGIPHDLPKLIELREEKRKLEKKKTQ